MRLRFFRLSVSCLAVIVAAAAVADDRLKYQKRGNRSEGTRDQLVAGFHVDLLSVRVNFDELVEKLGERLRLRFYLPEAVPAHITAEREQVIQGQSDLDLPPGNPVALEAREEEGEPADQVWRGFEEDGPFGKGFANRRPSAVFQVAKSAVDQSAGSGTGSAPEVVPVDQSHFQPAKSGLASDPGAGGAATDDEHIVLEAR